MNKRDKSLKKGNGFDIKERKSFLDKKWVPLILIILVSGIVYYNSVNTPFVYDDLQFVVNNSDIRHLSNIGTNLFRSDRPLTYLTFVLNYYFCRLNTFGYHLFNVIIHIFTSILIFFLVRKIVFYTYNRYSVFFPFLVSLLFAVHPINTEVVTYIYNRSASLATLFYLLSLLFFIKAVEKNRNLYFFSVLFFMLSSFSKQIAVSLPIIILIFDYLFLSNLKMKKVIEKKNYHIPFWIILIVLVALQYFYYGEIHETKIRYSWPGYSYYITQPWVIMKYLQLLLVPLGLCIDHNIEPIGTIFEFKTLISFLVIAGIFIFAWKLYKKRSNISKIFLFCILWFFVTLLPTSTFIVHIGERHLYLPGFGFCLLVVSIYFLILKRDLYINWSSGLFCLLIIHTFLLGRTTVKRNQLYKNPVLIWQDVISQYSNNAKAYVNLGNVYGDREEYDKAISNYTRAIEINPDHLEAYYNRGNTYSDKKEYDRAVSDFNQAIKISPNFPNAYYSQGNVYNSKGEVDKAMSYYARAIEIDSNYAEAYYNRGLIYTDRGEYDKAISDYSQAIKVKPYFQEAYLNRGMIYGLKGQFDKAVYDLSQVIKINPNSAKAYSNRGNVYFMKKEYDRAIQDYTEAIEIEPNFVDAYFNRGVVYFNKREYDKAISEYSQAIRLDPDCRKAYLNRGDTYFKMKQYARALEDFDRLQGLGDKIDPKYLEFLRSESSK